MTHTQIYSLKALYNLLFVGSPGEASVKGKLFTVMKDIKILSEKKPCSSLLSVQVVNCAPSTSRPMVQGKSDVSYHHCSKTPYSDTM
jgi:hypothetical protein